MQPLHDVGQIKPRVGLSAMRATAALCVLVGIGLVGQSVYMTAKAVLAQVLLERAFQSSLTTGEPAKPWSWADTWPVAKLTVPRIGASTTVLSGTSGQALAFGPGHMTGTPRPGEPGTSIVAAHRDTHFSFLSEIVTGDRIEIVRDDRTVHHFRVTHTSIVQWDHSDLETATSGHRLVLATCWPFHARTPGPLRYLVHAERAATPVAAWPP